MAGVEPDPPTVAAFRQRGGRPSLAQHRAYPLVRLQDDRDAVAAWLGAARALVSATTEEQVAAVVATLVRDLGGAVVPARLAEATSALDIDVSLGTSEPLLPWAEPVSVAAMRLAAVVPSVVEDARVVVARLRASQRGQREAEIDALTGLLTRRAWMRRLSTAQPDDCLAIIDLDHFKTVNDTGGHLAGDEVLATVGAVIRAAFRGDDACGRYGGDELAVLAPGMTTVGLVSRLARVRHLWEVSRPAAGEVVGLSAGVAGVLRFGPRAALNAADRALYRAKSSGRNRTTVSIDDDYTDLGAA